MKTLGLIYAGGQGRRLGGADKALLDIGGVPLWQRCSTELSRVADQIVIVSPSEPSWVQNVPDALWCPDMLIDGEAIGPAGALCAALQFADGCGDEDCWLATCPVDAPFYAASLTRVLLDTAKAQSAEVVMPVTGERFQPAFALWRASVCASLVASVANGTRALHRLASQFNMVECAFDAEDPRFMNVNTPDDLESARRTAGLHQMWGG